MDRNIVSAFDVLAISAVALRKESVDRNSTKLANSKACITVALRKESVDRNTDPINLSDIPASRSPQGERG